MNKVRGKKLRLGLAWLVSAAVLLFLTSRIPSTQAQPATGDFGPLHVGTAEQQTSGPATERRPPKASGQGTRLSAGGDWQSYPLYGGEMTSIAAHPTMPGVVYVGTRDAGVFKSTDGGQTWQPARDGLTFFPIRCLIIDSQHPDTLYAGTDYDGIWKTIDGGETWTNASSGLNLDLVVFSIVPDPQNHRTLYAALAGGPGMYIGHIYKSEDGGESWALRDSGIPFEAGDYINGVFALAVDAAGGAAGSTTPSTVYAGMNYEGVFRSTNGGATWSAIQNGLPFRQGSSGDRQPVNALALDPHHGNRLAAIVGGEYYIFQSEQWQLVNQGTIDANSGIFADYLYFHPTEPATLYSAGDTFKVSTDGGAIWTQRLGWSASGNVPAIAFHPGTPDTLYAATSVLFDYPGGVYKSEDQGKTWAEARQGIAAVAVYGLAVDPRDAQRIYAGTGDGFLYRTRDGGATWGRGYYTRNPEPYQEKVYNFGSVSDVAVDPLSSRVYIVANSLYTSTNGGEVFYAIAGVEHPQCIAMAPGASSPVYVGASFGRGIYKSVDGGLTWEQKNQGLPLFGSSINPILALAIDPNITTTVWAGTQYGGGILKSTDGGEHWSVKGLTETNWVDSIAVNPEHSNEILAGGGFNDGRIYKSSDGGNTWQIKARDIAFVQDIVYDPRNPRWVYAATEGYGVLRSFDGGEHWQDYGGGIFYPLVYALAITAEDPPLLVAGSYGAGLYWSQPAAPISVYLPLVRKRQ